MCHRLQSIKNIIVRAIKSYFCYALPGYFLGNVWMLTHALLFERYPQLHFGFPPLNSILDFCFFWYFSGIVVYAIGSFFTKHFLISSKFSISHKKTKYCFDVMIGTLFSLFGLILRYFSPYNHFSSTDKEVILEIAIVLAIGFILALYYIVANDLLTKKNRPATEVSNDFPNTHKGGNIYV